jgi:dihydrofolate reductase
MRKVIAAINMTLDGFCDHTAGIPDEEVHQHYTELLNGGDAILYGRITYQLMEYWHPLVKKPSGEQAMDDFAMAIDKIPKIVFSRTLKNVEWESARLANRTIEEEVLELKQQPGRNILVGSRSLIIQLMKLNLIDEYQLCIHPVVVGSGLPLFENINDRTILKLIKTRTFGGGAVTLYYEPTNEKTTNHYALAHDRAGK